MVMNHIESTQSPGKKKKTVLQVNEPIPTLWIAIPQLRRDKHFNKMIFNGLAKPFMNLRFATVHDAWKQVRISNINPHIGDIGDICSKDPTKTPTPNQKSKSKTTPVT